ncbi:hypothetical protein TTRE_0000122101 [Trichuris trichiura]|uniref:EGF-like domain-containing protein n=1 Tax=Trichuris trichiura TaxID=36087 RepID=A0A077YYW5_TRITR|nr:hypothetical protein TTRE_0000122101 [Trichuris trichiura]
MELSPLKYGGYITQNGKCVSFVPKEKIPKCGRYLHECLQEFCATEFSEGHLMHWDPKDLAKIKDPAMDKWKEAVKILNGRILINRVTSVQRRRGQRDAWTNFDCINFETFCGKTCFPVEHCSWYTDGLNWHFGRWHNFYFISDFLGDLTPEHEQRRLEKIELPACRNAVLYHSPKKLPRVEDLYSCREKNFDYFACEHNKSAACEMKEERECHYNKQHNDCRLFKYKIIVPPGKQGRPCPTQKEEKCECPCSGTPEEWTQWSATCGVMSRSRYRPKDKMAADCKTDSKLCCKEEETHVGEDCKNYAFNTSINLREKPCKKGIKGVDAGGHLECVCDLGFTGVLCEAGKHYVILESAFVQFF